MNLLHPMQSAPASMDSDPPLGGMFTREPTVPHYAAHLSASGLLPSLLSPSPQSPSLQPPVSPKGGTLTQQGDDHPTLTYWTMGGHQVTVSKRRLTVIEPTGASHVHRSAGPSRHDITLLLPDGTRITMDTRERLTIRDGGQEIRVDLSRGALLALTCNPRPGRGEVSPSTGEHLGPVPPLPTRARHEPYGITRGFSDLTALGRLPARPGK